jgi:hypothetical protein
VLTSGSAQCAKGPFARVSKSTQNSDGSYTLSIDTSFSQSDAK